MKKIIIFMILMLLGSVIIHETVHQEIGQLYGCKTSGIKIGISGFYVEEACPKEIDTSLAHSINEIVSYNIIPFLLQLIMLNMLRMKMEAKR